MYDIYGHMSRWFGRRAAYLLCVLWYAILIAAILYYSVEPQAEFNYLNL